MSQCGQLQMLYKMASICMARGAQSGGMLVHAGSSTDTANLPTRYAVVTTNAILVAVAKHGCFWTLSTFGLIDLLLVATIF